ncbi:MAG: maleylpyruvate isomerase family mycothiol-dependent enzyme [Ilumatobacteraceae bacterium]
MTISSAHDTRRTTGLLPSYIAAVALEGERFARVAASGALDVPIGACPDWDMRGLVRHLGEVHLWAAANVAFPSPGWLRVPELADLARFWPDLASGWPDDGDLVSWYSATHTNLVDVLRHAPPDVQAFSFLPAPTPLTMWARRQASEIAIHRFDAEQARGMESSFAPSFASDMLDELLSGFAPLYRDAGTELTEVLRVVATDVDEQWWVTMGPSGTTTSRTACDADLTLAGSAADLYLTLWNRTPGTTLDVVGDRGVLDSWGRRCRVVWSR